MAKLKSPRYLLLYGGKEAILNKGAVALSQAQLPRKLPPIQRIARYPRGYHLILRDLRMHPGVRRYRRMDPRSRGAAAHGAG